MDSSSHLSFYQIYDAHYRNVRGFVRSMVRDEWAADDLTQDTFVRAFRNIRSLKDQSKTKSWLLQIARNICMDYFRSSKSQRQRDDKMVKETPLSIAAVAETAMEKGQMSVCVQKQMQHLPETQREVLWLFEVMGFTQAEISDALGISVENVKVRLYRARRKFKVILEEKCHFEKDDRNVLICEPRMDRVLEKEDHASEKLPHRNLQ